MDRVVKKAIFPVAGSGSRMLPATKAIPKEMLPIVNKPAIQWIVEQAAGAGISEIVFITGRGKEAIESHFDKSFELEHTLEEKAKVALLEEVQKVAKLAKFTYTRQAEPLGDGHALAQAAHLVSRDEAVLVVFGDMLYDASMSPVKQMMTAYNKYGLPIIGLTEIDRRKVSEFGVVEAVGINENDFEIVNFVEKPSVDEAPSNLVVPGIYILTKEVFDILETMDHGESGEIRLADCFGIMLKQGMALMGRRLEGEWIDTGSPLNLFMANAKFITRDPALGEEAKRLLEELVSTF